MIKDQKPFADLSRIFIYYNERVIEHTVNEDSGAMIRDGIKTLAKQGVCTEKRWPYNIKVFTKKPTPAAIRRLEDAKSPRTRGSRRSTRCAPAWRMDFRSCLGSPSMKARNLKSGQNGHRFHAETGREGHGRPRRDGRRL